MADKNTRRMIPGLRRSRGVGDKGGMEATGGMAADGAGPFGRLPRPAGEERQEVSGAPDALSGGPETQLISFGGEEKPGSGIGSVAMSGFPGPYGSPGWPGHGPPPYPHPDPYNPLRYRPHYTAVPRKSGGQQPSRPGGPRWHGPVAAALFLLAIVIALSNAHNIAAVLSSMADIGPGHTTDEKTIGLLVLGFCGVLIVAVVRILCAHSGSQQ